MMPMIMKRLLCTFFVVLTYTIFTGANPQKKAALHEIIKNAERLEKIGQDTWGPLLTPVNIELNYSVSCFKEGLKVLQTKCKVSNKRNCRRYLYKIARNLDLWKVENDPICENEMKSFADFMSHLMLFLRKEYNENTL